MESVYIDLVTIQPFGKSLTHPKRSPNMLLIGSTYWGQVATTEFDKKISISLLQSKIVSDKISILEKHCHTSEIIIITHGNATMALAQSKNEKPDLDTLTLFKVKKGDAYLINNNIWHSGFILSNLDRFEAVIMYNQQTSKNDSEFIKIEPPIQLTE